jgi:hypothetical protein
VVQPVKIIGTLGSRGAADRGSDKLRDQHKQDDRGRGSQSLAAPAVVSTHVTPPGGSGAPAMASALYAALA